MCVGLCAQYLEVEHDACDALLLEGDLCHVLYHLLTQPLQTRGQNVAAQGKDTAVVLCTRTRQRKKRREVMRGKLWRIYA
jgi:hypothetical protein